MSIYRIYILNAHNHIEKRHDLDAPDDAAAYENAKTYTAGNAVEVWQSFRFIARLDYSGKAAPARNAHPG